ncbi:MAG TPA: hypothetical protein DDY18_11875, partial [Flavobacterium sp.]|nr:hypothetical protein [Flavobacterium sp.]
MDEGFNFYKYPMLLEFRSGDQRIAMSVRRTKHLNPFYRVKLPAFDIVAEGFLLEDAVNAALKH